MSPPYVAVRRTFGVWAVMSGGRRAAAFRGPGARIRALRCSIDLNTQLSARYAAEAADHWRAAEIWQRAGDRVRRR